MTILHLPKCPGYDSQGRIGGRTPVEWVQVVTFYLVFYLVLSVFWYSMLLVFLLNVPEDRPRWIAADSCIGAYPGVGIRPTQSDSRIASSLIVLDKTWNGQMMVAGHEEDDEGNAGFVARMSQFINETESGQRELQSCDPEVLNSYRPDGAAPCRFDLSLLGPCSRPPYGYAADPDGRINPCIIVKLNRIFGLKVPFFKPEDLDLPAKMPDAIKRRIWDPNEPRRIYMDCHGLDVSDVEALSSVKYMPEHQGIPLGFFPHQNKSVFPASMVAVQLIGLPVGQVVQIRCTAWVPGAPDHGRSHIFQILIQ